MLQKSGNAHNSSLEPNQNGTKPKDSEFTILELKQLIDNQNCAYFSVDWLINE